MGKYRYYDPDFKREAVRFVVEDGRGICEVAKSLGIATETLRNWLRLHRQRGTVISDNQASKPTDQSAKIRQLERELEQMRRERDILKKATAIFAKEPDMFRTRIGS